MGDVKTYRKLTGDTFLKLTKDLNNKLKFAGEAVLLSKRELEYLTVKEFNIPIFYIIPNVHKSLVNPPGRPIVSAVKGPLEIIGKYLYNLLKSEIVC